MLDYNHVQQVATPLRVRTPGDDKVVEGSALRDSDPHGPKGSLAHSLARDLAQRILSVVAH